MSTTVEIIIKGIAICYRKGADWHVLFPIDAERCHSVKFSHKRIDDFGDPESVSLAESTNGITITSTGAATKTSETGNFKNHVLDLTSSKLPFKTHAKIQKKTDPPGKAVLLTISNACFSVRRYLQDFSDSIPDLEEVESRHKTPITRRTPLAHSVKATVILNDGGQLTVKSSALDEDFVTEADSSYCLTFDNDCKDEKEDRNDMDMFYEIIKDTDNPKKGFRIGGLGRGQDREAKTEPPDFEKGKPCLVVQVTDPNDLP